MFRRLNNILALFLILSLWGCKTITLDECQSRETLVSKAIY